MSPIASQPPTSTVGCRPPSSVSSRSMSPLYSCVYRLIVTAAYAQRETWDRYLQKEGSRCRRSPPFSNSWPSPYSPL